MTVVVPLYKQVGDDELDPSFSPPHRRRSRSRVAVMYAKLGDRRTPRWMLEAFPAVGSSTRCARLMAGLAPVLPTAPRAARLLPNLLGRTPTSG